MSAIEEPKEKRRALGRGLDSLLPSGPRAVAPAAPAIMPPPAAATAARAAGNQPRSEGDFVEQIPLDLIDDNPYQTRRAFDPAALNELAESIKASGLAQPIVVRPDANGRYVLVLGERRCRASKLAGKPTIAAIVRRLGDEQAAEMTVIENLQRQDLNCLEQAQAFARLSRDFNLTQEQIGQRTGVSRESVANYIRLLKLPQVVLDLLGAGKLGFSEARLLLEALPFLDAPGLELLAQTSIELGLTVKQLKERVDGLRNPELHKPEPRPEKPMEPNVRAAQMELERLLGTRVHITDSSGKGKIVIEYRNLSDFDRVLELLGRT
jgi:ParB family chromosome partitioning protein